jgi:6-phosphogluconolactonase
VTAGARVVCRDADALADALAWQLGEAVAQPGAHVLLAGGRTPRAAYARMAAAHRAAHLWFSDERMVPPEHPDSNLGMVRAAWLERVDYPPALVHPIRGELGAGVAAAEASRAWRAAGAERVDLAVLGVGADGHTASLFPGDVALAGTEPFVPARGGARVSASLALLRAARRVVFVVSGADKAPILAALRAPSSGRESLPAELVVGPTVTWLIDRDADASAGTFF